MIINITFKNFRSIKGEQVFSTIANPSKLKPDNVVSTDGPIPPLLKTVALYGANGSGKSNLIRLIFSIRSFILNSTDLKTGDPISDFYYDPFLLDNESRLQPTECTIEFVAFNGKMHRYSIAFTGAEVLYEYLGVYESSRITRIFERKEASTFVEFGDGMQYKRENKEVPKNNAYLSKFGNSINPQMTEIYLYFKSIEVWNAVDNFHTDQLYTKIQSVFNESNRENFRNKLTTLINIADTKIGRLEVSERPKSDFEALPESIWENIYERYRFETFGIHSKFENGSLVGEERFQFLKHESQGTITMFAIGGLILEAFERIQPMVIFLDEFNNSLHPDLSKFLISLFHNPMVNQNNSQLVFATHDTTLLDNKVFRKDQIWFGEKNKFGETNFFSINDFKNINNIRSDIPFDKWYRTGKFGAIPNIRKFEFIAEYEGK